MQTERRRSDRPLAPTVLALVRDGVTPRELAARFAAEAAAVDEPRALALLDDLAHLGLLRIVSVADQPRYALTSLGHETLDATVARGSLADQLAELESLRSDLFSTVSHELRTPLTAIRTCVGLLLDPGTHPDEVETQQLLETIGRNADRMQRLVTDVLDLARYRTGHVALQLRRFDAAELASEVARSVGPLAREHRQTIDVVAAISPCWVFGDHRRLEQALVNLVTNAGKFSPDGAIVRIEVGREGAEVRWSVIDHGVGISPEDQVHLFERFFVGESDRSGPRAGVGLGLPTALAIAQAHGGRIEVDSAPGRGSMFVLAVPAEGPPDEEL